MSLPIRTTVDDISALCGYLATKPTGASMAEAKAVVDSKRLDGRKLSALKFWGLIEEDEGRLKITDAGRAYVKDGGARQSQVLRKVIQLIPPYGAIVERAVHRSDTTLTATEVAAHWHDHFRDDVSDNAKIINDQAVCFFQVAQGADLGQLWIGRKGQPTRFEFDLAAASAFISGNAMPAAAAARPEKRVEYPGVHFGGSGDDNEKETGSRLSLGAPEQGNRVFITHGKNQTILNQVKEIVTFGKFEPVVAKEHETTSKPVPDKVMEDMRGCQAAVIHVGSEGVLYDEKGREVPQVNGNVLIEIGAAMALYGRNFILLVEEGVNLPSNLQGLYECRYKGENLDGTATMKLLKAFNEFK